jgi:hypothetical protein
LRETPSPAKSDGADWDERDLVRTVPRDPLALDIGPVQEAHGREPMESFTLSPPDPSELPAHAADSMTDVDFDQVSRVAAADEAEDEAIIEAAKRGSLTPLDFETTRERMESRRTPRVESEYDEVIESDEIPIVTPEGGTSWRLSLVAFFITLALGVTIGLIWGYNLGVRKAAELAGTEGERQAWSEAPVSEPTSGAGQAILPPATPPVGVSKTSGRMLVRSTPDGARVTIDGQARGETPLDLHNMPFGEYDVHVSRDGFAPVTRRITLSKNIPFFF